MALTRKPAIAEKRIGDRATVLEVGNIRQRIEAIERLLTEVDSRSTASSNSSAQISAALTSLQAQITTVKTDLAALAALTFGPTSTFTADVTVNPGDVVFPTSMSGVSVVDPSDPFSVYAAVGVATTVASGGSLVTVQRFGSIVVGGYAFDAGRAVYAASGGGLTQSPPSYSGVAIPIGVAVAANALYVQPGWPALLADSFDPGFDDFLPVTLSRMRDEFTANVSNGIEYVFNDTTLDSGTRLAIVNAAAEDIIVTLPNGFIDGGFQTRQITVYRRDESSGGGGPTAVVIHTQSGQSIENFYPVTLADREVRSFIATGNPGWVQT